MAKEGAKLGDGNVAPFGNGRGATAAGAQSGGHNFVKSPTTDQNKGGGRDFVKESRPQSQAKPEVVPNEQEIPAGGKVMFADPGKVTSTDYIGGNAQKIGSVKTPFKSLK